MDAEVDSSLAVCTSLSESYASPIGPSAGHTVGTYEAGRILEGLGSI